MLRRTFFLIGTALFGAVAGLAQESSSRPDTPAASVPPIAAATPAAALRDVLSAACAQSQVDFARFLTARNKEAFSRMTPAARVALMKRFVLLNEPGRATVAANLSGRLILRCQTPEITTEMQIGGTDLRENIAFLPMELRDPTDTTGESVRQITMGFVREDGEWKLLSVGLLLLDIPALEVEWDAAESGANERTAIESMKTIAEAVEAYRKKYSRLPESLAALGPPLHGEANVDGAGLLDSDLATGVKNGYNFRYVIVGASNLGAPAKYQLAATPVRYGRTGLKSFFRDTNGGLHGADHQGAVGSETDSRAE